LLDGQRSVGGVVDAVVDEYAIGRSTAQEDVLEIVSQLVALGALEVV
jgi:hypothetical protein